MKIKIKENAPQIYRNFAYSKSWEHILYKIAGKKLEVDTTYLFKDQYNTPPLKDISDLGLRIMENLVEYVEGDIRPAYNRCNYCGKKSLKSKSIEGCPHCKKTEYLESLGESSNSNIFIIELNEEPITTEEKYLISDLC